MHVEMALLMNRPFDCQSLHIVSLQSNLLLRFQLII